MKTEQIKELFEKFILSKMDKKEKQLYKNNLDSFKTNINQEA